MEGAEGLRQEVDGRVVFSAFKRVLGDTLMARRFLSQKAEATLKVVLYNMFMSF